MASVSQIAAGCGVGVRRRAESQNNVDLFGAPYLGPPSCKCMRVCVCVYIYIYIYGSAAPCSDVAAALGGSNLGSIHFMYIYICLFIYIYIYTHTYMYK